MKLSLFTAIIVLLLSNFASADWEDVHFLNSEFKTLEEFNASTTEEIFRHLFIKYKPVEINNQPTNQWIQFVKLLSLPKTIQLLKYSYSSYTGYSEIGVKLLLALKKTGNVNRINQVLMGLKVNPFGELNSKILDSDKTSNNMLLKALKIMEFEDQKPSFVEVNPLEECLKSGSEDCFGNSEKLSTFKGSLKNFRIVTTDQFLGISAHSNSTGELVNLVSSEYIVSANSDEYSEILILQSQAEPKTVLMVNFGYDQKDLAEGLKLIQENMESRGLKLNQFSFTLLRNSSEPNKRLAWEVSHWLQYNGITAPLKIGLISEPNKVFNVAVRAETGEIFIDNLPYKLRLDFVYRAKSIGFGNHELKFHSDFIDSQDTSYISLNNITSENLNLLRAYVRSLNGEKVVYLDEINKMNVRQLVKLGNYVNRDSQDFIKLLEAYSRLDSLILVDLLESDLNYKVKRSLVLFLESAHFNELIDLLLKSRIKDIKDNGNMALSILSYLPSENITSVLEDLSEVDIEFAKILQQRQGEIPDYIAPKDGLAQKIVRNVMVYVNKEKLFKTQVMNSEAFVIPKDENVKNNSIELDIKEGDIIIAIEGATQKYFLHFNLLHQDSYEDRTIELVNGFILWVMREEGFKLKTESEIQRSTHIIFVGDLNDSFLSTSLRRVKELIEEAKRLNYTHQTNLSEVGDNQSLVFLNREWTTKDGVAMILQKSSHMGTRILNTLKSRLFNKQSLGKASEIKITPIKIADSSALNCEKALDRPKYEEGI
ncbi:MAG: hypothetical protein H6625_00190 [Bdellovibrionaceae bacterium]|nr:hypothetical protein [Pseudobdellovibrionaceae bacterium]